MFARIGCAPVAYRGRRDVQMTVLLMQRIATWLGRRDSRALASHGSGGR
ncbi:MAG TPA: hypothetical protein VMV25_05445 [Steroidobacteraceae bacterium]|nr:hypothetical protein [Steroidobacteraceae bacterium]